MTSRTETGPSVRRQLLFWWILFVMFQSAERLFLLKDAVEAESSSPAMLVQTLLVGLRGDFIVATIALVLAAFAGVFFTFARRWVVAWRGNGAPFHVAYRQGLNAGGLVLAGILFLLLFADMGYYGHNRQRLDFVFLEYLGDLFSEDPEAGQTNKQAAQQTGAELSDTSKWGVRIAQFLLLELLAVGVWCWTFTKAVAPALSRWRPASSLHMNVTLGLCLAAGAAGFHHQGPYGIRIGDIDSTMYYTLAQNPVLFAPEALRGLAGVT